MSTPPGRTGVFVSCVSTEFEDEGSEYPGLRSSLRHYLARHGCHVQEDFPQVGVDTVEKLDGLIRERAAVVHLVGAKPGAKANGKAVAAYLAAAPDFLDKHPDVKAALGDCSDLTYTQWEAFIALHHGIPLFVYATDHGTAAQESHLERLKNAGRFATPIRDDTDLFGKLIGDIGTIVASVPMVERRLASSRLTRHAARTFFGRERELERLDRAWSDDGAHVLSVVAWGGMGKTSLVSQWVATRFIAKGWPGVERYFDWSFYSQGTGDSRQTSSDLFIHAGLTFFGDDDPKAGSTWERGERLARLIRERRTLLVLDGVEPLQYPPTAQSGQAGRFKDQGLEALIQGLAQDNNGLCVVTTREHLASIEGLPTQREQKLEKLLLGDAAALLRHLRIVGSDDEIAQLWDQLDGHALSILQLGRLLVRAYGGKLVKWREIGFDKADRLKQGRSTMRVMRRYEEWLQSGSKGEQLELAVLRLMGLFDRPMSPDCFRALRQPPAIPGLTDLFAGVADFEVEAAITTLIENDLMSHGDDDTAPRHHLTQPLDAHPLIREYFATQLRQDQPEAFTAAHSRLFDFLCKTTPDKPDTLDVLQPLYEAVAHGCRAGRYEEAWDAVYMSRILRESRVSYATRELGLFDHDLAALAGFFESPWDKPVQGLPERRQAFLLSLVGSRLRALGRLDEAVAPLHSSLTMHERQQRYVWAALKARHLAELHLARGDLAAALKVARNGVSLADMSAVAYERYAERAVLGAVLHHLGEPAEGTFVEAERILRDVAKFEPLGMLYSLWGYRYCDFLVDQGKAIEAYRRGRWMQRMTKDGHTRQDPENGLGLISVGLEWLVLGRAGLHRLQSHQKVNAASVRDQLDHAVEELLKAGRADFIPLGYLSRAAFHRLTGDARGAREDLNLALAVINRSHMEVHRVDYLLELARLELTQFKRREAAEALNDARELVKEIGYGRRKQDLDDLGGEL